MKGLDINTLKETKTSVQESFQRLPDLSPAREDILGLKYKKGDVVYDARTGKKLIIIAGTRKSIAVHTS